MELLKPLLLKLPMQKFYGLRKLKGTCLIVHNSKHWRNNSISFKTWRCGGRFSNADVPYGVKHPILLPKDHHFTLLVVRQAHVRVLHNGVKDTLNEVRSKFWIVKGRSFVKKVIHQCVTCKRFEGRPCLGPPPPPLPRFRVAEDPPFTHTGVDFARPLFIRMGNAATMPRSGFVSILVA